MTVSIKLSAKIPSALQEVLLCDEQPMAGGGKLAILTLNRASTLNALDLSMVTALLAIVQQWRADSSIHALFIDSRLDKAFCAGGDVRAMRKSALARTITESTVTENTATESSVMDEPCIDAEAFFAAEYRLDYTLHSFGKPVIIWGHGIVMGGGLGIFVAGSHRIATAATRIAMPEITIALFPDVGAAYFLPRMPGRSGIFCALTAARLNATDACYAGLATHFLAHGQKQDVLQALLSLSLSGDLSKDNSAITKLLNEAAANNSESAPPAVLQAHQAVIDQCCMGDDLAVMINNILDVKIDDDWWRDCQMTLRAGSPITARVIERQLRLSATMTLAEVFQLDYMLATNIVRHPEFSEGVRALLVDKDRQPRWIYASVNAVPDALIDDLFTPPWPHNPLADMTQS
jgi:enoyl-CoA hydratase/carnithine racemase